MKLFSLPDGFIDTHDRAQWLTPPFDGFNVILVDDTFTSTNTFTLTPNNVITVSESESSTNTFTLTPNNVITVSESESSTNTFSSSIIITFEVSFTNSSTNTFTLTPNNVITVSESESSTNTFTLTPNNVITLSESESSTNTFNSNIIVTFETSITNSSTNTFSSNIIVTFEASITNSSTNTFTLTPNNVIGTSMDLDATGEFNEDIILDKEVELNLFSTNTVVFTVNSTFDTSTILAICSGIISNNDKEVSFDALSHITFNYVFIPRRFTFNDVVTLIRDSQFIVDINVIFNVKVDFRTDFDLPGNFEPEFASINISSNVDYVFFINLNVISNLILGPNLVSDRASSLIATANATFITDTNIFKSFNLNSTASINNLTNVNLNIHPIFNLSPNLVINTSITYGPNANINFQAITQIYKNITFIEISNISTNNTLISQNKLNLNQIGSFILSPNKVIDQIVRFRQHSSKMTVTVS